MKSCNIEKSNFLKQKNQDFWSAFTDVRISPLNYNVNRTQKFSLIKHFKFQIEIPQRLLHRFLFRQWKMITLALCFISVIQIQNRVIGQREIWTLHLELLWRTSLKDAYYSVSTARKKNMFFFCENRQCWGGYPPPNSRQFWEASVHFCPWKVLFFGTFSRFPVQRRIQIVYRARFDLKILLKHFGNFGENCLQENLDGGGPPSRFRGHRIIRVL